MSETFIPFSSINALSISARSKLVSRVVGCSLTSSLQPIKYAGDTCNAFAISSNLSTGMFLMYPVSYLCKVDLLIPTLSESVWYDISNSSRLFFIRDIISCIFSEISFSLISAPPYKLIINYFFIFATDNLMKTKKSCKYGLTIPKCRCNIKTSQICNERRAKNVVR